MDLILRDGEHLLDLGDIRVSNNELVLILILVEVHSGPHARIHEYSPHCFVDTNLVRCLLLRHAKFSARVPENPFHKRPIFRTIQKGWDRPNLCPWLARWFSQQVSPCFCACPELPATHLKLARLRALESLTTSLSVLRGSKLEQLLPVFTRLYRVELELGN